ncbi:MAG: thioredoxin [Clostridia bacterium]|nr:thioredoxin [Clostridia bacterium]
MNKTSEVNLQSGNIAESNDLEKNNGEENKNMAVMSVSSENFEEEVLKSDKKVLIDFYADWCGPCKMLSPIVEAFASENSSIKVVKVDIDVNPALAAKYGVSSIPTLIVIENGEVKNTSVGLISKSEVEALVK